jgi:predicted AAA+ superfamily ATPase
VNPKKIYVIDNGFYSLHQFNPDKGKQYENVVFLHLRRMYNDIYYFKASQEVDFCIETPQGILLINVSYELSGNSTREREINGLTEAMQSLQTPHSLLITRDAEEIIPTPSGQIHVIPLYKWLLDTF